MTEVIIDAEFAALCPPLTQEEYAGLEGSILKEGCRDALIIWDGADILLDGHNRKHICDQFGIEYQVAYVELPDREAAIEWIIRNQLARRNLPPDAASLLRGRLYNARKANREDNLVQNKPKYQNDTSVDTAKLLSAQLGVSAPTIKRDGAFAKAVDDIAPYMPDITDMVMKGDAPSRQAVIDASKTPEQATHL
jgi:hypothetical protein